jgi:hypothetical protein
MNAERFLDAIVQVEELLRQSEAGNTEGQLDLDSLITHSSLTHHSLESANS